MTADPPGALGGSRGPTRDGKAPLRRQPRKERKGVMASKKRGGGTVVASDVIRALNSLGVRTPRPSGGLTETYNGIQLRNIGRSRTMEIQVPGKEPVVLRTSEDVVRYAYQEGQALLGTRTTVQDVDRLIHIALTCPRITQARLAIGLYQSVVRGLVYHKSLTGRINGPVFGPPYDGTNLSIKVWLETGGYVWVVMTATPGLRITVHVDSHRLPDFESPAAAIQVTRSAILRAVASREAAARRGQPGTDESSEETEEQKGEEL